MKKIKENITQILLIIISVLIAFSVDRCYEDYKDEINKKQFFEEQISRFESEIEELDFYIDYNRKLIKQTEYALAHIDVDTVIFYSRGLPNLTNFEAEFKDLKELRDVYDVDKFLNSEDKVMLRVLNKRYDNVEYYEANFENIIKERFGQFWINNHNSHNDTFDNKNIFKENEYLNIIESCKRQLINKNTEYQNLKEELNSLKNKLEKSYI